MKKLIFFLISWPFLSFSQQAIVQENNDSATLYLYQAKSEMQQGKPKEALSNFQKAAALQPNNSEAYIGWFQIGMETDQVEEGSKAINSWIEHNPTDTLAWLYKGFLEAHLNRPEEALKAFDTLIRLQPEKESNYVGRGQMLYELERYDEALEAFNKSISMDPSRNDVRGMKSAALSKLGRFDEAFSILNEVLETTPDDPVSLYNRACLYSLTGYKENALLELKKAIDLEASFKESARTDEDFKDFFADEDFINLTK